MYSTTMKRYVSILKQLDESDLDDDVANELEEELENLYYDLDEDEIAIIETEDLNEISIDDEDE